MEQISDTNSDSSETVKQLMEGPQVIVLRHACSEFNAANGILYATNGRLFVHLT